MSLSIAVVSVVTRALRSLMSLSIAVVSVVTEH